MKVFVIGFICALVAGTNAGYASSSAGAGASAGSTYANSFPYVNSNTYTFSGAGGYGLHQQQQQFPGFGAFPPLPPLPYFNFGPAFNDYISQINNAQLSGASAVNAVNGASASASTSLGPNQYATNNNIFNQQLAYQSALANAIQSQFNHAGAYPAGFAGAASSAGYGPNGVYQSTSIYPSNPYSPNLDTRFGDAPTKVTYTQGRPGVGISTASFASSSDVNGVKNSHRESITSVNDNGKVTSYHTHS